MTSNGVRVRFAPSPTGHLHIGSARTALFNWLFAKSQKGVFALRIEDTDIARSTKEFEQSILKDLNWLGLDFDEGPDQGNFGPYHQSERFDIYRKKAEGLIEQNKAYYCFCTEEELQTEKKKALVDNKPPRYSGRCKKLSPDETEILIAEGRKPAVRFSVESGVLEVNDLIYKDVSFDLNEISDFIILRTDKSPTFHLAVVVDDGEMQISHVIRGEDHLSNTPKHILLFKAMGYKVPEFAHIPIILGKDRSKLSKRHGATSIAEYRKQGFLPQAMINYLSLLSWSPKDEQDVLDPKQIIEQFELQRVSKSPAIFDSDKLKWLNGQHIRKLPASDVAKNIKPYLETKNMSTTDAHLDQIADAIQEDLVTLDEAPDYAAVFFEKEVDYDAEAKSYLKEDFAKKAVESLKNIFSAKPPNNFDDAREMLKEHSSRLKPEGIKGKNAFMPVRLALTGRQSGTEIYYLLTIIDDSQIVERLDKALSL